MWRGKCAIGPSAGWSPRDANPRGIRVLLLGQASFDRRALDSARRTASRQVSRRLSRARRDNPADAIVDTSFSASGRALRPAFVDRRTTVDGQLAAVFAYAAPVGRSIHAAPGPLKCRPSHTAQFPVRRRNPLRSSARARPSRIVCPWLLFRPFCAVWLRVLSVFDRSSRGPSRTAAGAGRDGEQAASSWAGRRTERQRLAQRRGSLEESARQARSADAGAAPEGVTSEPSLPRRWRLPRGATARYARQPSP